MQTNTCIKEMKYTETLYFSSTALRQGQQCVFWTVEQYVDKKLTAWLIWSFNSLVQECVTLKLAEGKNFFITVRYDAVISSLLQVNFTV